MLRILIADDHRIFREGLRKLLEAEPGFRVVGEAGDGAETIEKVRALAPDILLLDLSMPRMHGLDALRDLVDEPACPRILLLTAAIDKSQLLSALQLGARGVVMKDSATALLLKAIRGVMAGEYWVGRESVADLVLALRSFEDDREKTAAPQRFNLTEREFQIMALIVGAAGNKEIAEKLLISEKTVKHHLTNIFDKLGLSNRLELAMFALHHHLDRPELGSHK